MTATTEEPPVSLLTRWEEAGRPDPPGFAAASDLSSDERDHFLTQAASVLQFGDTAVPSDTDGGDRPATEVRPDPPDGYALGEPLGSGGAGAVWSATAPGGGTCAVKFTPRSGPLADDEIRGLELLREVNHPHVIHVYAFWVRPRDVVIAMERATGSLESLLKDEPGGVPGGRLLKLFADAAAGLDFMNARGVRHCDVKPHNLFWIDSGGPAGDGGHERGVVADFGIAQQSFNAITEKYGASTVLYTAPEVLGNRLHLHSDQWSLALSWLHLRTGRLPNRAVRKEMDAALRGLPRRERAAVRRGLREDPDARWASCSEFVRRLRLAGEPHGWVRRKLAPALALAAAALAGLATGAILWR